MRDAPPPDNPTLDPSDWEAFRALAHQMVDDALDRTRAVRERPLWRPLPNDAAAAIDEPLPTTGIGEGAAYEQFRRFVEPYTNGNRHPGFFGWVQGCGTPLGAMADMLAATMNPFAGGFDQSCVHVERRVIAWLAEMMGFPRDASGVLVSGGSMANFIGLAAARDARAGFDIWNEGLQGDARSARPRLVFYASDQMHGWAGKSANLLGLGNSAYRRIPSDALGRVELGAMRAHIAEDRAAGHRPFCVMGSAGTVSTGAFDDLDGLADLAAEEGLWLHVDGAFGAWVKLSRTHAHLARGMERADSLAFDLHKWGCMPYEVACVLVRRDEDHLRPFGIKGHYIQAADRGPFAAGLPYSERAIELTRSFKALKVWMSFKAHGLETYARLVDQNIAQAARMAELVRAHPRLELASEVVSNVVCFRYVPEEARGVSLDALNREIMFRVQESGRFLISSTTIDDRLALRACFVNHRTRTDDIDELAAFVVELGDRESSAPEEPR